MRALVLWLLAAITGVLYGLRHLDVEVDILSVLPPGVSEVEALRAMRMHFQTRSELLVLVEGTDAEHADGLADQTAATLAALPSVKSATPLGGGQNSAQAGAMLAWMLQNGAPERLRAIVARLDERNIASHLAGVVETLATSPDTARVQRLSYDPLGLTDILGEEDLAGALDADDGALTGFENLRVIRVLPRSQIAGCKDAISFIRDIRHMNPGLPLTGEIAFMAEAGGGMERDLSSTISTSVFMIAALFWTMYRRVAPLLWIITLLTLTLGVTVGLGAIFLGKMNAMNLGFAAIVLGLVVDYGVLIYEERRAGEGGAALRARVLRSILGAAGTTAAVFSVLLLSSFPGLRELGALVAIGVISGAGIMLTTLPVLLERGAVTRESPAWITASPPRWLGLLLLLAGGLILVTLGPPGFDGSSAPLRMKRSDAMVALEKVQHAGSGGAGTATRPLLITAGNADSLRARASALARAPGVWLPLPFLPNPEAQITNRPVIAQILMEQERLLHALAAAGFTSDSLTLFREVMRACEPFVKATAPLTLQDSPAADVLSRFVSARADIKSVALLGTRKANTPAHNGEGVFTPAWDLLGPALSQIARQDALSKMLPLGVLFLSSLFFVLRRPRDVSLAALSLLAGFFLWLALLSALRQTWNLASIAAIPLLIGTGIDYSIHILLALQRERGDARAVRAATGRAVIFCALSSCAGFGSLSLAGNGAIASLGIACASGLAVMMFVAVWLLPEWRVRGGK